jgi:hypothetical protein
MRESWIFAFTSVGLAISYGDNSWLRCIPGKSFSLFLSVLDLGALTTFRLQGDKPLPEFEVKNIVAPGVHAIFGIHAPFVVGFGAQYGPQLRKIEITEKIGTEETVKEVSSSAWRFGAFVSVDIPIFNFYSAGK